MEYTGTPLVDFSGLEALVRLLYLADPLGKATFSRVFQNLACHGQTRNGLLAILVGILRAKRQEQQQKQQQQQLALEQRPTIGQLLQKTSAARSSQFSPISDPCHPLLGFRTVNGDDLWFSQAVSNDRPPRPVIKRILDIMVYLTKKNPHLFDYMFDEKVVADPVRIASELALATSSKGKGKKPLVSEDDENRDHLTPFARLLGLLGDNYIIQSSETLEALMELLAAVVAPMQSFEVKPKPEEVPASESAPAAAEAAAVDAQGPAAMDVQPAEAPVAENAESAPAGSPAAAVAVADQEASKKSKNKTPKSHKAEEPAKKICPVITIDQLKYLPHVLTLDSCSEKAYLFAITVLRRVCANEQNRQALLNELLNAAGVLAKAVSNNLSQVEQRLAEGHHSAALSIASGSGSGGAGSGGSSKPETSFLRLLKLMNQLVPSEMIAQLQLDELWDRLNGCIEHLNKVIHKDGSPLLSLLTPVLEAFFIVHTHQEESPLSANNNNNKVSEQLQIRLSLSSSGHGGLLSSSASAAQVDPDTKKLSSFMQRSRTVLNILIKQNPALLDGSFALLVRHPAMLDFDNKRTFFRTKLHEKDREDRRYGGIQIRVRRERLFEDSYHQLVSRTPEELRGRLSVQFQGEEGIDAGGVLRDWYSSISREVFNPNYALFITSADGSFQPNCNSYINPDHLNFFEFCGRVMGKCIYDGALMDAHFTRSFYKHILGQKVTWKDMEAVDEKYFESLVWILKNDITDMDMFFITESVAFGKVTEVELKPDGRNIPVTEENKEEFVQLRAEQLLSHSIREQIDRFLKGFYELIPKDLIGLFNAQELELLISGLPDIDVEDMRRNTEYTGYRPDSPIVQGFFQVVQEMTQEERALLLQFVTGNSKVPLEGFAALQGMRGPQKFHITRVPGTDRLPSAHTCFNQLDLPEYESFAELKERLLTAIKETAGFGFG